MKGDRKTENRETDIQRWSGTEKTDTSQTKTYRPKDRSKIDQSERSEVKGEKLSVTLC